MDFTVPSPMFLDLEANDEGRFLLRDRSQSIDIAVTYTRDPNPGE